jgi:hypothetical protein
VSERSSPRLLASAAGLAVLVSACTTASGPAPQLSAGTFPERPEPVSHTSSANPIPGTPASLPIAAEWNGLSGIYLQNVEHVYESSLGYRSAEPTTLYLRAGEEPGVLYGPPVPLMGCIAKQAWSDVSVTYRAGHDVAESFACDPHAVFVGVGNSSFESTSRAAVSGQTLTLSGEVTSRVPRLLGKDFYFEPAVITHRESIVLTIRGNGCEVSRLDSETVEKQRWVSLQYGPGEPETTTWRNRLTPATSCELIRLDGMAGNS